jgi:hypothetical protein
MLSPPIVPPPSSGGGGVEGIAILVGAIALAACGWLGARFAEGKRRNREGSGDRVPRLAPLSVKTKERSAV